MAIHPSFMPRPNILLLLPDQWRSDWFSPIAPTPVLDRLAARGVRFTQCVTPSPLCAPARASLALGCGYDACDVPSNEQNLPLDRPNFYRSLRDAGYSVGGVGKFDLAKSLHHHGGDGKRRLPEWGFTHGFDSEGKWDGVGQMRQIPLTGPYGRYLESLGQRERYLADMAQRRAPNAYTNTRPSPLDASAYGDNWVARSAITCLHDFPTDRPWFLQVNFPGPHDPLDAPSWVLEGLGDRSFPAAICHTQHDEAKMQDIRRAYSAMTTNIDALCGQILDAIAVRGQIENTLILFSSDHGEMLGDYDRWGKSTWHEASIRVPLLAAGPGVTGGRVCEALVQLEDLAATCIEVGGAKTLPDSARSIVPLLRNPSAEHRSVLRSALKGWDATMDRRWKLVHHPDGAGQLFDRDAIECDAHDMSAQHERVVERLRAVRAESCESSARSCGEA